jgi:hypothetical protein
VDHGEDSPHNLVDDGHLFQTSSGAKRAIVIAAKDEDSAACSVLRHRQKTLC